MAMACIPTIDSNLGWGLDRAPDQRAEYRQGRHGSARSGHERRQQLRGISRAADVSGVRPAGLCGAVPAGHRVQLGEPLGLHRRGVLAIRPDLQVHDRDPASGRDRNRHGVRLQEDQELALEGALRPGLLTARLRRGTAERCRHAQ